MDLCLCRLRPPGDSVVFRDTSSLLERTVVFLRVHAGAHRWFFVYFLDVVGKGSPRKDRRRAQTLRTFIPTPQSFIGCRFMSCGIPNHPERSGMTSASVGKKSSLSVFNTTHDCTLFTVSERTTVCTLFSQ